MKYNGEVWHPDKVDHGADVTIMIVIQSEHRPLAGVICNLCLQENCMVWIWFGFCRLGHTVIDG